MKDALKSILKNLGLIIISLGLLYGGVLILRLQIPFWSMLYGLAALFLGIIMTLISFNEIAKNRETKSSEYHQVACRVCHKMTLVPLLIEDVVCTDCQYKSALKIQIGIVVFLTLVAIPLTFHLAQTRRQYEQRAAGASPTSTCSSGIWSPEECRCGIWPNVEDTCLSGEKVRSCGGVRFCCIEVSHQWHCRVQ